MIELLSMEGRAVIEEIARGGPIVGLDFDGTLAPIVEEPDDARMDGPTHEWLRRLAERLPCALITGRARADALARVAGIPFVAVHGNHGAEVDIQPPPAELRARIRGWVDVIRGVVDPTDVQIEDKGYSLAVHYRRAREPLLVRTALQAAIASFAGGRLVGGHAVVNVIPSEAPGKDGAIASLAAAYPARPVLFIGDDEVDEDAFRSTAVTWAVRVGHAPGSGAGFFLRSQEDVARLFRAVIVAVDQVGSCETSPAAAGTPEGRGRH